MLVVAKFIVHPLYDPNDQLARNDIAVIVTETPIQFNQLVGPCCLPFRYYSTTFSGQTVELLGMPLEKLFLNLLLPLKVMLCRLTDV